MWRASEDAVQGKRPARSKNTANVIEALSVKVLGARQARDQLRRSRGLRRSPAQMGY